jgi:hypothetical protein
VHGKAVVSATRTIRGTLTGDREQPVVPLTPDAVELRLDAVTLDHLKVESSDSDAVLTQISGTVSAVARPRLAASDSSGVCMVPTPNLVLSDLRYTDAKVHVVAEGRRFYVDVPTSDVEAVNGRSANAENFLGGQITVWGHGVELPNDDDGLNPDFDPERFVEGFACTEDLALPVSHECAGLGPVLAPGGGAPHHPHLGHGGPAHRGGHHLRLHQRRGAARDPAHRGVGGRPGEGGVRGA